MVNFCLALHCSSPRSLQTTIFPSVFLKRQPSLPLVIQPLTSDGNTLSLLLGSLVKQCALESLRNPRHPFGTERVAVVLAYLSEAVSGMNDLPQQKADCRPEPGIEFFAGLPETHPGALSGEGWVIPVAPTHIPGLQCSASSFFRNGGKSLHASNLLTPSSPPASSHLFPMHLNRFQYHRVVTKLKISHIVWNIKLFSPRLPTSGQVRPLLMVTHVYYFSKWQCLEKQYGLLGICIHGTPLYVGRSEMSFSDTSYCFLRQGVTGLKLVM